MDAIPIRPATIRDFREVLDHHERYWGQRDLRALHVAALIHQFPRTCLVAATADGIRGYLFGFVTPDGLGYTHLIATRDDARGTGLGRRLYEAFTSAARDQGATRLEAITTPGNRGSIAFHRGLGFDARLVCDYDGPGADRMVFTKSLSGPP
ncbi:GCN5-like N-acetyltransferase [Nocardia nova SH22a]|uniref:GCN5-like N-acetyltransferase n=1 Tax=Nocardia nova SH22a TaxID=1415166 RepID=W5TIW7_9NOCA|nr:GNAT family N-acetyltransferase [Nocardia nova]AHH17196.1 GCN5-like N-acetyltransferase [Nocardia nova SH22a]